MRRRADELIYRGVDREIVETEVNKILAERRERARMNHAERVTKKLAKMNSNIRVSLELDGHGKIVRWLSAVVKAKQMFICDLEDNCQYAVRFIVVEYPRARITRHMCLKHFRVASEVLVAEP